MPRHYARDILAATAKTLVAIIGLLLHLVVSIQAIQLIDYYDAEEFNCDICGDFVEHTCIEGGNIPDFKHCARHSPVCCPIVRLLIQQRYVRRDDTIPDPFQPGWENEDYDNDESNPNADHNIES